MFTIISRIFHFGFKNFWRNGWLTTVTVIIMTLALLVFAWLIFFGTVTSRAASSIEDKIDISVYFNTNTAEDEILNIQQSLKGLPQVASVDYVSQDQALATFKQNHAQDTTITQAVNELNSNPLEASLNIKAKNPSDYSAIASYLNSGTLAQYIDTVSYTENQSVIDRLAKIVHTVEVGGAIVMIVFALLAGLVVFNTIRLAIYANREEIGVMRVVGASNALVRGPFVVEGMLCGAIAAVLALVISAPILFAIDPYLNVFIPGMNLFGYFSAHIIKLFLYLFAFGIALGGVSSFFAVKRYLKN
ncbi:MAG: permease-like cell division protein FtsX [Minisyncoccia bacterium]